MNYRDARFDVIKGIGILLVIAGHFFTYGSLPFSLIFSFHMPLFFIISGYFKYSKASLDKVFIYKWLKNYILPYAYFSFVALLINFSIFKNLDIRKNLSGFYDLNPYPLGQIWFLAILAIISLLTVFFEKIHLFKFLKFLLFLSLSLVFAHIHIHLPILIKSIPMALTFFYFGDITVIEFKKIEKLKYSKYFVIIIVIIWFLSAFYNRTVNIAVPQYNNIFPYLIASIFGIYITFWLSGFFVNSKFFAYVGRNSLYIFCIHSLFLYLFAFLLTKIMRNGIEYQIMKNIPILLSLVGLIFGLFCSIATIKINRIVLEKMNSFILGKFNL